MSQPRLKGEFDSIFVFTHIKSTFVQYNLEEKLESQDLLQNYVFRYSMAKVLKWHIM